ncbi:MAG: hypothetical protein EP307_12195, partial [Rhodobacteraceae bacterium]
MTAQRKVYETPSHLATAQSNIFAGDDTGLFTTSCGPATGADMLSGDATALFTTSCGPERATALTGGGTALYTTSCAPQMSGDGHRGEATA